MHIHYFTLKKIAQKMNESCKGDVVGEIFTQQKDELVIGFANPESSQYLRISCHPSFQYVWPLAEYARAKKNVADLFPDLVGKLFYNARVVANDRVLILEFEKEISLILKMHGSRANILLRKGSKIVELFRQSREEDFQYHEKEGVWDEEAIVQNCDYDDVPELLRNISPMLDKYFAEYVRANMEAGKDFSSALSNVLQEAESDQFYIARSEQGMKFCLFPSGDGLEFPVTGIFPALDLFFRSKHQFESYSANFQRAEKSLKSRADKIDGQIGSYRLNLEKLNSSRSGEEIGSMIMANLHVIPSGAEKIKLLDFYNDVEIELKLDPRVSPQQNAERQFRKQKDRKKQITHITSLIQSLETESKIFRQALVEFESLPTPVELPVNESGNIDHRPIRTLNAFIKKNEAILEMGNPQDSKSGPIFMEFEYSGFTILVGRNAKNNDELTFAHCHKEDLWLHARDVAGSHVVVRRKGKDFPRSVKEYAASLAAKFSKRKHERLAPVICTLRKYVRKPKGAMPGQVLVEREEVLMVEPAK